MRWTLDLDSNALYVYLGEGAPARQVVMPDGTIVDVDGEGAVVGIEVMRPGAAWDIDALVGEFGLEGDTALALAGLAMSPIVQVAASPPGVQLRVEVRSAPTSATTQVPGLVRGLMLQPAA